MTGKITITVNETRHTVEAPVTLFAVRQQFKADADVIIHNGFPVSDDAAIGNGDYVVLIRKGEQPSAEELESLMVARHGPGIHQKIRNARVGIAGCGGLGSALAIALARTGVGSLQLVDFDVVEPSNLNRQQYFIDQIGQQKVDALADNLARINPFVTVVTSRTLLTQQNAPGIFASCQVIAECLDRPDIKRDLAVGLRKQLPDTPLVTVSGIAGTGPANDITTRKVLGNVYLVGDLTSEARPGLGLLAPRVTIAAGHQANVIIRLLLGDVKENDPC